METLYTLIVLLSINGDEMLDRVGGFKSQAACEEARTALRQTFGPDWASPLGGRSRKLSTVCVKLL